MFKENKKTIILTLIITLLPILIGLLLWNKLPDEIAIHFDANNQPNGWSGKPFAVFGIPVILGLFQMICIVITTLDPKKKNIGIKGFKIVLWIIPACSLIVMCTCYATALGYSMDIGTIVGLFIGILFIVVGNYLPKNKKNYTFGIRCRWTLDDEGNWNYTNRIGGYCFVIGGILIVIVCMLKKSVLMVPIIILQILIPYICSYIYYRKHQNNNGENQ